jgi:hypothetical protein
MSSGSHQANGKIKEPFKDSEESELDDMNEYELQMSDKYYNDNNLTTSTSEQDDEDASESEDADLDVNK